MKLSYTLPLSALLFMSVEALAIVYPGANCRAVGSNQSLVNYDDRGRIHNSSPNDVRVVCPIPRENHKEGWSKLKVTVADRHPSKDISCEAYSGQEDGLGWALTKSSGTDPEWYQFQALEFDAPTDVRDNGSFYLICNLPGTNSGAQSGVLTYSVTEKPRCSSGQTVTGPAGSGATLHYHSVGFVVCF